MARRGPMVGITTTGPRVRAGDTSDLPEHGFYELEQDEPNGPGSPSDRMLDAGPLRSAVGRRTFQSNQPASLVVGCWESRAQSRAGPPECALSLLQAMSASALSLPEPAPASNRPRVVGTRGKTAGRIPYHGRTASCRRGCWARG